MFEAEIVMLLKQVYFMFAANAPFWYETQEVSGTLESEFRAWSH